MYNYEDFFQVAEYKEQNVPSYKGNPFIEALPNILSEEDFMNLVNTYPIYDENERNLPIQERIHCLNLVYECFQQLDFHEQLEVSISNVIRQGYIYRNPISPEFVKILNLGFTSTQNKNIDMYNVNSIRRTTSCSFSVTGTSGMGKSSIVNKILSLYPQVISHSRYKDIDFNTYQLVWLKLDCPHDGSIKGLCLKFFSAIDMILGTNYYMKYGQSRNVSVNAMMPIIAQIAQNHGLGVLVVDEIQHLSIAKSGGIEKMLNFFVTLINMIGIPVILIGTPEAKDILSLKFRQARRSSGQGNFEIDRLKNDDDWENLMNTLFKYQWTNKKFDLTDELSNALYEESFGIIDTAVKIYVKSQQIAIMNDFDIITPKLIEHVSKEYFKLVREKIKDAKSPHKEIIVKQKDMLTEDIDELAKSNIQRNKNISKKSKDDLDCTDLRKITDTDDSNYNNLEESGYIKSNI